MDMQSLGKASGRETHYNPSDDRVKASRMWDWLELSKGSSRDSSVDNMEFLEEFLVVVSWSGTRELISPVKVSSRETKHLSGQVEEEGTVC